MLLMIAVLRQARAEELPTEIPEIHRSQIGDPVRLCLVSTPEDCPPGDDGGKVYSATNLRTGESWEAPDSQHSCGGA